MVVGKVVMKVVGKAVMMVIKVIVELPRSEVSLATTLADWDLQSREIS